MWVHDDQGTTAFGSMWSVPFLPIFFSLACAPVSVESDSLERLCLPADLDRPLGHLISTAPARWVENPASGARLRVWVLAPEVATGWTVVLVPPGLSGAQAVSADARRWAEAGAVVVVFDPDGRGSSEGAEDYGGAIHQAGLVQVVELANELPCTERVGLVSFSFGVTMATGAFVDAPGLPVEFHIDWEGPSDRYSIGCKGSSLSFPDCSNEDFWAHREASQSIRSLTVPYHRLQGLEDHVQDDLNHARQLLSAALESDVPAVYLNRELIEAPPASLLAGLGSQRGLRRSPGVLLDWAERVSP